MLFFGSSFEQLVTYLRDKSTIMRCKNCLERYHRLANLVHKVTRIASDEAERVNVRIFLAAYMIVARPMNVFDKMGALEQQAFDSARLLLEIFEKILYSATPFHDLPADLTRAFTAALFDYLRKFKAWKVPNEAQLICRIKHALVALYQARTQLPADEPEDSQLNVEFRTQITRLR